MEELIKIKEENGRRAVSARELHNFLGSKQDFSTWIKNRIEKYGFTENVDYQPFHKFVECQNGIGGTHRIEYALSIDMAKELSMIENNEKGRMARKYFIACEKELKQINQKPMPFLHSSNCRYHFVGNKNKFYMENDIQIFKNEQFGQVRIAMGDNGEPLFCAKDVATALGYIDTSDAIKRHCKSGKKVFHPHSNGIGGVNVIYVSEKDVYRLIMRSNLPYAEKFQDWVCDEILPSIRKHGVYMSNEAIERTLTDPDYLIRLAKQLKEERQKRIEVEEKNKKLTEDNAYKEQVIEGLVYDIPVADMRQRINQIVLKDGSSDIRGKWIMLYDEFDRKYHMKVSTRMTNSGYEGTRMDYIDKELHMITELYDLACKLFESSYEQLMESWGKYAKRAERYKSQA